MFCYFFIRQRCGWVRTVTTKGGIPNDRCGSVKVAVTVCTVPILVSGVCAEACQWCIEQWVTMAAVGMFASIASVGVRPVWRTRRHYIYSWNGRSRACEGRCSQTLFFRYDTGGATATVSISCALWVTSTDVVGLFSPYLAVWPSKTTSLRVRLSLCTDFGFDLRESDRLYYSSGLSVLSNLL